MKAGLRIVVTLLSCVLLLTYVADIDAAWETLRRCGLVLGIASLVAAPCVLLFSFTDNALDSALRLVPRRFADSAAVGPLIRLHQARAALGNDPRRIANCSVLILIEHLLMMGCYGWVAVALRVEFNALFPFAAVPLAIPVESSST